MISRKMNSKGLGDIVQGEMRQKDELVSPPVFWVLVLD